MPRPRRTKTAPSKPTAVRAAARTIDRKAERKLQPGIEAAKSIGASQVPSDKQQTRKNYDGAHGQEDSTIPKGPSSRTRQVQSLVDHGQTESPVAEVIMTKRTASAKGAVQKAKIGSARSSTGSKTVSSDRVEPDIMDGRQKKSGVLGEKKAETLHSRAQTPSLADESLDTELYGLSPSGEITHAVIAEKFQQRRLSMQQSIGFPASGLNVRATPGPELSSMSAIKHFKRRPRQHSMLRMAQQASELGDQGDQGMDDFDLPPEDESTPLHMVRSKIRGTASNTKFDSTPATSSSRKRKRTEQVQVPNSPDLESSPPPGLARSLSPSSSSTVELPDRAIPSTEQQDEPLILSDVMADPLSSSVLEVDVPDKGYDSAVEPLRLSVAPPATSDHKARTAKARGSKPKATISTTVLESLLPRVRNGRRTAATSYRDAFDLPSSTDQEEAEETLGSEEENPEPVAKRRNGPKLRVQAAADITKVKNKASTMAPQRKARNVRNDSKGNANKDPQHTTKSARTYGRRLTDNDKENIDTTFDLGREGQDVDQSDSDAELDRPRRAQSRALEDVIMSKEMQAAKQKFQEVDDWDMEYESAAEGLTSSDWR